MKKFWKVTLTDRSHESIGLRKEERALTLGSVGACNLRGKVRVL